MVSELSELVTGQQVGAWLIIAILVLYFVYKEWPDFKKRITTGALKEQKDEDEGRSVSQRLDSIEKEVKEIHGKLDRDYYRINELEAKLKRTKESQGDINQELEIIMRALIAVLQGLQEQGANGPTKDAEKEIQIYLNSKAHKTEEE